ENRSTKSADGRMATEAARLERKESTGRIKRKNRKTCLTHTGLLMEGNGRVARHPGTTRIRNAPRLFTIGSETKQVEWLVSDLDELLHPIGNYGALSSSFQSDGDIR
ncbi:MAG TPA: hypothetical protein VK937_15050, partial [Candidatus Limnocylindria bacterium]|nr:hypothetical protein [Candidatus Limnocylindria bacterium]